MHSCVLAFTFFSLICHNVVLALFQPHAGIIICSWTDGSIFHPSRLKSGTEVLETRVCDFVFVYDYALATYSEIDQQEPPNYFSTAACSCGLTGSLRKIEVPMQPAPRLALLNQTSIIQGTSSKNMDTFICLGRCIT